MRKYIENVYNEMQRIGIKESNKPAGLRCYDRAGIADDEMDNYYNCSEQKTDGGPSASPIFFKKEKGNWELNHAIIGGKVRDAVFPATPRKLFELLRQEDEATYNAVTAHTDIIRVASSAAVHALLPLVEYGSCGQQCHYVAFPAWCFLQSRDDKEYRDYSVYYVELHYKGDETRAHTIGVISKTTVVDFSFHNWSDDTLIFDPWNGYQVFSLSELRQDPLYNQNNWRYAKTESTLKPLDKEGWAAVMRARAFFKQTVAGSAFQVYLQTKVINPALASSGLSFTIKPIKQTQEQAKISKCDRELRDGKFVGLFASDGPSSSIKQLEIRRSADADEDDDSAATSTTTPSTTAGSS